MANGGYSEAVGMAVLTINAIMKNRLGSIETGSVLRRHHQISIENMYA